MIPSFGLFLFQDKEMFFLSHHVTAQYFFPYDLFCVMVLEDKLVTHK